MKFETSDYGQHWVDGHFATVATGYGALRFPATASLEEAKMTITLQAVRTEAAVRDAARKMAATLTYSTGRIPSTSEESRTCISLSLVDAHSCLGAQLARMEA